MKNPSDYVQWLDELFIALDLDRIHLMGLSYGGWMSVLYALAHPERLSKLVLLAPPATVLKPPIGLMVRAILYGLLSFRFYIQRYMYWYAPDCVRSSGSRSIIDAMVDDQMLGRKCFKSLKFIFPTVLTDGEWQKLSVPTLFLVGENEVTYSAKEAVARLDRVAPNVTSFIASRGDHHLYLVRPDWTSDRVLEFLNQ